MHYYQLFLQHRMGFRPTKDSTARQGTLIKDNKYILMDNTGIRSKLTIIYMVLTNSFNQWELLELRFWFYTTKLWLPSFFS